MKNKDKITTKKGDIVLPAFLPDATYGTVKSVSFQDVKNAGISEIVTTTLHIEEKIGSQYIKKIGGIHKFMGWDRPILTDSGGWQVFSLINSKPNSQNFATEVGCSFINSDTGEQTLLTPENSIQIQANLNPEIVTVLDFPILGDASLDDRTRSVERNTRWAKRAKDEYSKIFQDSENRPLLGCVIQGANDFKLRKRSAEELLELGFDVYNFGGLPLHTKETWKKFSKTGFFHEMLEFVSELIPSDKYKYAMGVGQPTDIAYCVSIGWDLFDTVLPTRNARHGYLYVSEGEGEDTKSFKKLSHDILRIKNNKYKFDEKPVDSTCDCECCKTVSRMYLRHLLRMNEPSGFRLATIHNLRFYSKWMEKIREEFA